MWFVNVKYFKIIFGFPEPGKDFSVGLIYYYFFPLAGPS